MPGGIPSAASDTRLKVAGVLMIALLHFGALTPRSAWFDYSFGFEAWRDLPLSALLVSAVALLILLLWPGLGDRLARGIGAAVDLIPRWLRLPALLLGLAVAFLLLTNHRLSGDAMTIVLFVADGKVYPSNSLTSTLQLLIAGLPGQDALEGVRLLSVASGVVFALAAVGISRSLFADRARRAGLTALLLTCGAGVMFFGTLEVYGTLLAGTAVYLYAGVRHIRHGTSIWFAALALGVTFCLHGSVGLLFPSLAVLVIHGGWRSAGLRRWLAAGAGLAIPVVLMFLCLYFLIWGGEVPEDGSERVGSFLGAMDQVPILQLVKTTANLRHRYVFLDLDHTIGIPNLVFLAAPLGLLLVVLYRIPRRDPLVRWVAVAAGFLIFFPVFWNISYSLRRDWDLFSNLGVPLTLLGGIVYLTREERPGRILTAVAISLFAFLPVVIGNYRSSFGAYAGDVVRAFQLASDPEGRNRPARQKWESLAREYAPPAYAVHGDAAALQARGNQEGAAAVLRKALQADPGDASLMTHLGIVYFLLDDNRAEPMLRAAVREDSGQLPAWIHLALLAREEGRQEEAVRLLERGIRVSRLSPHASGACRLLGDTLLSLGQGERASVAYNLAEKMRR